MYDIILFLDDKFRNAMPTDDKHLFLVIIFYYISYS